MKKGAAILPVLAVLAPVFQASPLRAQGSAGDEARAARVHRDAIVIDTHADTPTYFEDPTFDFMKRHDWVHVDHPKLRDGGYDAVFLVTYMGKTEGDGTAVKRALRRMDAIVETVRRTDGALELAATAADIRRISAAGRVAAVLCVEGGHMIEDEIGVLRTFHRLGVRYMTLTHTFNTGWADSSGRSAGHKLDHGGLSPLGETLVREMQRIGMMVDISHVADETLEDVLSIAKAPVIASHSSCRALCDHRRNLTDAQLRAIARNGGVAQINFYPRFIDPEGGARMDRWKAKVAERLKAIEAKHGSNGAGHDAAMAALLREVRIEPTPWTVVIEHIEHALKVAGPDHVGLGADWDGVEWLPEGLEDCSKVGRITAELLARGHSEETVTKVLGGNLLRVMEACERHAAGLR